MMPALHHALRATLAAAAGTLVLSALPACRAVSGSASDGRATATVTETTPLRAWLVRDDGRQIGSLILYGQVGEPQTGYYSVRNAEGQVLGLVDFSGRAWRYRLHESEPEWLGTGTILEGARRILGAGSLCDLEETPLGELAGS